MKHLLLALSLITGLALSNMAQAREVTFTTQLARYNGNDALIAIYLIDSSGRYKQTIWLAGGRHRKYLGHLRGWSRGSHKRFAEYDGKTGASITQGRGFTVTEEIDDALIDQGYRLVIDVAVEDRTGSQADVVLPLTTAGSGKPVTGSNYIISFKYDLK